MTEYEPIGPFPKLPFVLSAAVALLLGGLMGRKAPLLESIGVAALLVLSFLVATYTGMMRYTAATSEGPVTAQYTVVEPGLFEHRSQPPIDLRDADMSDYWALFPPGSSYSFQLLHKENGITLVDMKPVYAENFLYGQPR